MEYASALAAKSKHFGTKDKTPVHNDYAGSPSDEATYQDPAAVSHYPCNEGQKLREKSKFEASEPYRQKKGDRFS